MILRLLDRVSAPLVVTLHTILADPDPDQRRVMDAILRRASRIIVMAEMGRRLLEEVHHVEPERVTVIPHGIPIGHLSRRQPTSLVSDLKDARCC